MSTDQSTYARYIPRLAFLFVSGLFRHCEVKFALYYCLSQRKPQDNADSLFLFLNLTIGKLLTDPETQNDEAHDHTENKVATPKKKSFFKNIGVILGFSLV